MRGLLNENQHPLAEEVTAACRYALDSSVAAASAARRARLNQALQKARDFHYL